MKSRTPSPYDSVFVIVSIHKQQQKSIGGLKTFPPRHSTHRQEHLSGAHKDKHRNRRSGGFCLKASLQVRCRLLCGLEKETTRTSNNDQKNISRSPQKTPEAPKRALWTHEESTKSMSKRGGGKKAHFFVAGPTIARLKGPPKASPRDPQNRENEQPKAHTSVNKA